MAEILILASNKGLKTDPFAWLRGHIIAVKPDGHPWGTEECWPKFIRIQITDMTVDEVAPYLKDKLDINFKQIKIRDWFVDVDDVTIPVAIKNKLTQNVIIKVTKAQIINFFKRMT